MQQQTLQYKQSLDARFDQAVAAITASESQWQVSGDGKVYYVSPNGNDANDGLSPERAWATVGKVNETTVAEGSVILFERGGVWNRQGTLRIKKGVTFSAYGTGDKPLLSNCIDANATSDWTKVGENLWVYSGAYASPVVEGYDKNGVYHSFPNDPSLLGSYLTSLDTNVGSFDDHPQNQDVGCIIFGNGESWGVKMTIESKDPNDLVSVNLGTVWNGLVEKDYPSIPFADENDLCDEGTFFHNPKTSRLYLCCTENPATKYGSVKLVLRGYGIGADSGEADGAVIDNIAMKYFGAHGISVAHVVNFTIRNCEIGWIGGSIHLYKFGDRTYPTRFGEGIQNWGRCDGFYVKDSWIYQVYDGALSSQQSSDPSLKSVLMKDIQVTGCLFEYNTESIEMWQTLRDGMFDDDNSQAENYGFVGMRITDNLFRNIGYGFGNTRPGIAILFDEAAALNVGDGYYGKNGFPFSFVDCEMSGNVLWSTRKHFLKGLYWDMDCGFRLCGNTFLADYGTDFGMLPTDFDNMKSWDYAKYTYTDAVMGDLLKNGIIGNNDFYYLDPTVR